MHNFSYAGNYIPSSARLSWYLCWTDWNHNDELFKFTRGRFLIDEAERLRKRETWFDMNKLASIAAESVGSAQCIRIRKYPDGMFNKAYLMTMNDGKQVVAKVPNPNTGIPHFNTASEVATMDFVRLRRHLYAISC